MQASQCSGFSCYRAQALGARASLVVAQGLISCEHWPDSIQASVVAARGLYGFSSCGACGAVLVQLLLGMWNLSRPGIETCGPCLGRWILIHCATRKVLRWCLGLRFKLVKSICLTPSLILNVAFTRYKCIPQLFKFLSLKYS